MICEGVTRCFSPTVITAAKGTCAVLFGGAATALAKKTGELAIEMIRSSCASVVSEFVLFGIASIGCTVVSGLTIHNILKSPKRIPPPFNAIFADASSPPNSSPRRNRSASQDRPKSPTD